MYYASGTGMLVKRYSTCLDINNTCLRFKCSIWLFIFLNNLACLHDILLTFINHTNNSILIFVLYFIIQTCLLCKQSIIMNMCLNRIKSCSVYTKDLLYCLCVIQICPVTHVYIIVPLYCLYVIHICHLYTIRSICVTYLSPLHYRPFIMSICVTYLSHLH